MRSRVSAWLVDMMGHLDRVTIQASSGGISRSLRVLICELGTPGRPPPGRSCEEEEDVWEVLCKLSSPAEPGGCSL